MIWLLDTNAFVRALNGEPAVRDRLNQLTAQDRLATSVLVLGELIYGAECSARREENRRLIESKLAGIQIIEVTRPIAERFGILKADLRRKGRPKADVDLLIAATALEAGTRLVTADGALLAGDIPGLLVESWA